MYTAYKGVTKNIRAKVAGLSGAAVILIGSLSGALPLLTSTANAQDPAINISSVSELCNAIDHQADGQVWNIQTGTYALSQCNTINAGGQTGWYFPITANNLTINGNGATIYGSGFTANGAWHTQDFMAIFGNNDTVNGLTIMPKVEPNKAIEVLGDSATIENVTIKPNTLTDQSEYDNPMGSSTPTKAEAKQWGGSIYYNNAGGTQTLSNVTIENGGVSVHAPSATFNLVNVNLDYASSIDWINDYGFYVATPTTVISGTPTTTYHVNSTLDNLNSVMAGVNDATLIGTKTVLLDSDLTVPSQVTINKNVTINGQGHTVSVSGTGYRLLVKGDGTTLKNMNVGKTDKAGVQNIIGVQAPNVTIDNVNFTGKYVDGDSDVSRAIEISDNNFTIKNSSFKNLRQPAYINSFAGTISNNYVGGTKGWVAVQDSDVTFTGNTWGTNATDIAIIQNNNANPNHYTCSVMAQIRTDNHNATIDNQALASPCDTTGPTITVNSGSPATDDYLNGTRYSTSGQRNRFVFNITDPSGVQKGYINLHNMSTGTLYHYNLTQHGAPHEELWYADVDTTKLPDGVYQIEVRAVDNAGNARYFNNRLNSYSVTIDNTSPVITAKNATWDNPGVADIADGSTVSTVVDKDLRLFTNEKNIDKILVDGSAKWSGSWLTGAGGVSIAYITSGTHTFQAVDKAGNTSNTITLTFDNEAPYHPTNLAVNGQTGTFYTKVGAPFTQTWKDKSKDVVKYNYVSCYVDTKPTSNNCSGTTYKTTTTGASKQVNSGDTKHDETFFWQVQAVDAAGNVSGWSDWSKIVVDSTAPTIENLSLDHTPTNGDSVTVSGTISDPNLGNYKYQIVDANKQNNLGEYSWSKTGGTASVLNGNLFTADINGLKLDGTHVAPLPDGNYFVRIWAADNSGNQTGIASHVYLPFTIDTTGPELTYNGDSANNNVITPDFTATDAQGSTPLTYTWTADSNNPTGASISDAHALNPGFTVTNNGDYKFTLTASDSLGNTSTASFTFAYTAPSTSNAGANIHSNALLATADTLNGGRGGGNASAGGNNGGAGNGTGFSSVNGQVLGASTNTPDTSSTDSSDGGSGNSEVKGLSTTNQKAKQASNFLGLGWWWLPVLVVALLFILGLRRASNGTDKTG
jgi:hypothetical protein